MTRPSRTMIATTDGGSHQSYTIIAVVISGSETTLSGHLIPAALQVWPTVAAQIDIVSAAGAGDSGRKLRIEGVLAGDSYTRVALTVILDGSGEATIPVSEGWLDVVRMFDLTDGATIGATNITASAGGVDLCRLASARGRDLNGRDYVPAGEVAYLQSVDVESSIDLQTVGFYARPLVGAWVAVEAFTLGIGAGAVDPIATTRDYTTSTSRGSRVVGPARLEWRGRGTAAGVLGLDYRILFVPASQDAL